ncbi:uncharacterized protein LOC130762574 isoform X1 [Actinidia eriantha]|uniref:uncharacterized protein LOC130762574 isoform X1 n=1 Tax=Actinidia eriantha TaxID=165200 RepID=UPI002584743B|nr:uncharacterized protein LOC130762574 isoform X1 [Actinidia eriantha]
MLMQYIGTHWQSMPLSNRSLCWAHLNEGIPVLFDAEACVMMRPDWVKAHYGKNFHMAAYAFLEALKLDPENKELETAFSWNSETFVVLAFCGNIKILKGSWERNSTFGEGLAKTFVDVKNSRAQIGRPFCGGGMEDSHLQVLGT